MSALAAYAKEAASRLGWKVTNSGEALLAIALHHYGYRADVVETQFTVGPYRLDFALVEARVDIEADGWVHTARDVRKRDRIRDRRLRSWGWTVIRIDLALPLPEQLSARVPHPGRLAEYARTLESINAGVHVALWEASRFRDRAPNHSAECLRAVLRRACEDFTDSRRRSVTQPSAARPDRRPDEIRHRAKPAGDHAGSPRRQLAEVPERRPA